MIRIAQADLTDPEVRDLIAYHQRDMQEISPPGTSFALDLSGLSGADVTLLGGWKDDRLVTIGALKRLGNGVAELKSMRTLPDYLGRGYGTAMLDALIELARSEGVVRLSLETGTSTDFAAAIALYSRKGFVAGDRFAGYVNGPHNQCYHLNLEAG